MGRARTTARSPSVNFSSAQVIRAVLVVQGICLVVGVLWTGYAGMTWSEVISFRVDDGWCSTPVEGVGAHCFGDYPTPYQSVAAGVGPEGRQPLPASALAVHSLFGIFGHLTSYNVGLAMFLTCGAIGLGVTALAVSRNLNEVSSGQIFLMLVLAWPVIAAFDRGTSVILALPALALAITSASTGREGQSSVFVLIAALVRPQFLLLQFALSPKRWLQVSSSFFLVQALSNLALRFTVAQFRNRLSLDPQSSGRESPDLVLSFVDDAVRSVTVWIVNLLRFEASSELQSDLNRAFPGWISILSSTWVVIIAAAAVAAILVRKETPARLRAAGLCFLAVCASQASTTSPGYYYTVVLTALLGFLTLRRQIGVFEILLLLTLSTPLIYRTGATSWYFLNREVLGGILFVVLMAGPFVFALSETFHHSIDPETRSQKFFE